MTLVYWSVDMGVEVLVEGVLSAKWPIALVTLKDVSWGIQVLLQCSLTAEVSIATMTVFGRFCSTIVVNQVRKC